MNHERHAILFVTPFDADTAAVNRLTGGHGFGHVALWNGLRDGDTPIVLDSSMTHKCVSFRRLPEMTQGVPYHSHELPTDLGRWMFDRALSCLGKPYDFAGLFRKRRNDDAFTCSGLVCCALPAHLERHCRSLAGSLPVSPNAIARAFGVPRWNG